MHSKEKLSAKKKNKIRF